MSKQSDVLGALQMILGALGQAITYSAQVDSLLGDAKRTPLFGEAFRTACEAQRVKTTAAMAKLEVLGADVPELTA